MKEYQNDCSSNQHCTAESPAELPSESHDLGVHGSPCLTESQEIKVSITVQYGTMSQTQRSCVLQPSSSIT